MRLSPTFFRRCSMKVKGYVVATGDRAHLVYFACVFFEAHGPYAYAAGACLMLGVVGEAMGAGQ